MSEQVLNLKSLPDPSNPEEASNLHLFILAQARVAFSKSNRNAGFDVEDFVAIGYEVYDRAAKTWDPNKNTKFNTYLTLCLQNKFFKVMRATHAEKRGGNGNNRNKPMMQIVSMDEWMEEGRNDIPAVCNETENNTEYELLVEQVGKFIPKALMPVFKQMVDPDAALLKLAHERSEGAKRCVVDTKLIAEYLHMDVVELRSAKRSIQSIVQKELKIKLPETK